VVCGENIVLFGFLSWMFQSFEKKAKEFGMRKDYPLKKKEKEGEDKIKWREIYCRLD